MGKYVCPAPVPSPHLRITDITPVPEGKWGKISPKSRLGMILIFLFQTSQAGCLTAAVEVHNNEMHNNEQRDFDTMLLSDLSCVELPFQACLVSNSTMSFPSFRCFPLDFMMLCSCWPVKSSTGLL